MSVVAIEARHSEIDSTPRPAPQAPSESRRRHADHCLRASPIGKGCARCRDRSELDEEFCEMGYGIGGLLILILVILAIIYLARRV